MAKGRLDFEASAYLQRLIGRELFRRDDFAVLELVKNAYDSGATRVTVAITPPSTSRAGEIIVTDDGEGMTLDTFRDTFMVAGFSERPDQVVSAKRIPTGEKGVGRFASDRLGTHLSVLTKTVNDNSALKVDINWKDFDDRRRRFNQVSAPFSRTNGFSGTHGTVLCISGLRSPWTRQELLSLRRSLERLFNPFQPPKGFVLQLEVAGAPSLSDIVTPPRPSSPDILIRFSVVPNGMIRRTISGPVVPDRKMTESERYPVDTRPLVGLNGRFLYYLKKPTKAQAAGLLPAVSVYRDGFRIEPLGSDRSDWLGVEAKRAKRAGHAHVVPSRLFGFVSIRRKKHKDLTDVTSRESLLDNDATRAMISVLTREIGRLERLLLEQVATPRWEASRAAQAQSLERARLHSLSMMSLGLAHEMRQPMQVITTEVYNMKTRLAKLGVEDSALSESETRIQRSIIRIDENIEHIAAISNGDLATREPIDLAAHVRSDCVLLKRVVASKGCHLRLDIPDTHQAVTNPTAVSVVLRNLVSNAAEALDDSTVKQKEVLVRLSGTALEHVIEVTDNGPGIPEAIRSKIFSRFTTKKTGGWGIGLYNCSLLVKTYGGSMSFTSQPDTGTTFTARFPESSQ